MIIQKPHVISQRHLTEGTRLILQRSMAQLAIHVDSEVLTILFTHVFNVFVVKVID